MSATGSATAINPQCHFNSTSYRFNLQIHNWQNAKMKNQYKPRLTIGIYKTVDFRFVTREKRNNAKSNLHNLYFNSKIVGHYMSYIADILKT